MRIRRVTLQDQSSLSLPLSQLQNVAQALQIQLDRDFTPEWGVHAVVQALDRGESVPANAWPMSILDQSEAGLGVHLDKNSINGIEVSDFITQEFYDTNAPAGTLFDFLGRLSRALDVPEGCYISWLDPEDQRWHQKQPDGSFITARAKANPRLSPRDQRDRAFSEDENRSRHNLLAIHAKFSSAAAAKSARP